VRADKADEWATGPISVERWPVDPSGPGGAELREHGEGQPVTVLELSNRRTRIDGPTAQRGWTNGPSVGYSALHDWHPTTKAQAGGLGFRRPVEVPGIEPGSFVASQGLLRAQSALPLLGSTGHANKPV
jgi:hypothetical protein